MNYTAEINGMEVRAVFPDENVERIWLPLLRRLTEMQEKKGGRLLVMLAAPPGAGKSTLAGFLRELSGKTAGVAPITVIGMDGFHRRQEYLLSHRTERNGVSIPMVEIKGAPETFDLEALTERVGRVAAGEVTGWPEYDRMTHDPKENAIRVSGDIVLLEGNYLLLDTDGWRDLKRFADYTIRISAPREMLRARLISRKLKSGSGSSKEAAVRFVEFSDLANADLCLAKSMQADLDLVLRENGSFAAARAV